jgi:hypothetical protein
VASPTLLHRRLERDNDPSSGSYLSRWELGFSSRRP